MKILMLSLPNGKRLKLKGFTILEVVVSMVVLVVIAGSLAMVFRTLTATWNRAETGIEVFQSAYTSLEQISRELKSAIIDAGNKFYLLAINTDGSHIAATTSDEIYFVAPFKDAGQQKLYEVGYWLRDTGSDRDDSLRRHLIEAAIPLNFTSTPNDTFATNITGFELFFWGETTTDWSNASLSWDSRVSGRPTAIRIELRITDNRRTLEREFEKVIFLPSAS